MREIKFRVWHKRLEEMLKPNQWNSYGPKINYGVIESDDHEIMQYTGLKDKNGKEIYEGDVVIQPKWFSVGQYLPATGEVKYLGVRFTVDCIGQWKGAHAELNGNSEVIGNIYENPELLTPTL